MALTPEMIAELRELERLGGGELTTEAVVERAREPTSALHNHPAFEWDVSKAALQSWMNATRSVIQVFVGLIDDGGERKPMRQYVHVYDSNKQPVYRSTQKVLQENRATIINVVCDRIISTVKSYPLSEFDPVVELIDQIRADANAPKPKPKPRGASRGSKGGESSPRP